MKQSELIYGFKPVWEAINSGKEIEKLLIQKGIQVQKEMEIKKIALLFEVPFQYVPKEKLNKLTRQNHQGIVAIVSPIAYSNIENLLPSVYESGKVPFLLILDKITDVRNLGAIARTAECAGVDAIVLPSRGSAMINADAMKTSAGALHQIPVCRQSNLKETIQFLKGSGIRVVGASEKAGLDFFDSDFSLPTAIVMGSEEKGISEEYLKLCDEVVKIPMPGKIASLNVAVAAGILMFEVVKQRLDK
ncbi:MAG: 23S rRNA (guanosine(2251)-2'-O)-methyltransferase RlmB [Bacteroidales bacterium]|nr:23S rRNA (guanosine(2251)-2'-O)-methyltransferase RlmB [Bacteroidales bacterium]